MKRSHDEQEDIGIGLSLCRRVLGFDPSEPDGSMERMLGLPVPAQFCAGGHLNFEDTPKSATLADIPRYRTTRLEGGCQLIHLGSRRDG